MIGYCIQTVGMILLQMVFLFDFDIKGALK